MKEERKKELKMKKEELIKYIRLLGKKCLYVIIIICIIYNILYVTYTTFTQEEYIQLFGTSAFCMETDLMREDIAKNELVIVKKIEELQVGDIIAYKINGKIRINKIVKNKNGEITTKSNKNYNPDIEKITEEQIIGKKVIAIPILGIILTILHSRIITIIILLYLIFKLFYNKYIQDRKQTRIRKWGRRKESCKNYVKMIYL